MKNLRDGRFRARFAVLCTSLLGACAGEAPIPEPDDPYWADEYAHDHLLANPAAPEPGVIYAQGKTVTQASATYCSTVAVAGLSEQLAAEIECLQPNTMANISGLPGVTLSSGTFPFMQKSAAGALAGAASSGTLQVNSAFRSVAQQYMLYYWFANGRCTNVVVLAAPPGRSNHESGLAVDLQNWSSARSRMQANTFRWLGAGDPVHYDYNGGGIDLRPLSVKAFQRLWNRNNPGNTLLEDGIYGPATAAALGAAPADGFAQGASCGDPGPTAPDSALALEVYWERSGDTYDLRALAPAAVASVAYFVDGHEIGGASRADGNNFPDSYTFTSSGNNRHFEVRGYDASGDWIATGVGSIDVTEGTGVYIRQMGEGVYEIGLERAPAGVAAIEVRVGPYLLTDSVSDATRSPRGAVRSFFHSRGPRSFAISTFNADGSLRGTLHRDLTLL